MGLFGKKKKIPEEKAAEKRDDALRDEISRAYDEIMSGGTDTAPEPEEKAETTRPKNEFGGELLKMRIQEFKKKKTQESILAVMKLLPNREFFLPAVSNMKEPFEKTDNKLKLKKGAVLNPALLNNNDGKMFLPIFTGEKEMTQKSPSGVVLKFKFEQCVSIVYDKKNPVWAVVINPFTDNMIIGEELLKMVFKPVQKRE